MNTWKVAHFCHRLRSSMNIKLDLCILFGLVRFTFYIICFSIGFICILTIVIPMCCCCFFFHLVIDVVSQSHQKHYLAKWMNSVWLTLYEPILLRTFCKYSYSLYYRMHTDTTYNNTCAAHIHAKPLFSFAVRGSCIFWIFSEQVNTEANEACE